MEQIEAFQKVTHTIHQGLVTDFDRITMTRQYDKNSTDSLLPHKTDWAAQWEANVYEFFPASSYGRNSITFFLLPNQPMNKLFSLPEQDDNQSEGYFHGLLGVLNDS